MDFRISTIDTAIVLVYVLATLAFGLWIGRGPQSLSRYMVGGRDLPWWVVLGSIIATETSAVTFLSVPGLAFVPDGNSGFLQLAIGLIIGRMIVVVWFLPSYFQGDEVFTAYDVLRTRFGGLTQRAASAIFIITRTVADGLRLYLTALVLGQVSGIDLTLCVFAIGIVTVVYAAVGGIRSVAWNDCIQLVVYLIGAIAAVIVIAGRLPEGLQSVIEFGKSTERFRVFEPAGFSFGSANVWAGLIGGIFITLATHGTDQLMVQRYLCARGLRQAKWAVGLSGPLVAIQFALFLLVGVALAAWVNNGGTLTTDNRDEVFASFIVDQMPVGLCGVTLAAVFSVAMSTLSSSLSSSSSAVVNDFLKPRYLSKEQMEQNDLSLEDRSAKIDRRLTAAGKLATVVFGCLQMAVAIFVIQSPNLVAASVVNQVITVAGFSSGLIVGIFFLGKTRRQYAQRSGLIGMFAALIVTTVLIFPPTDSPWKVHGWWAAAIASCVCFGVASIVDRLFPQANAATRR